MLSCGRLQDLVPPGCWGCLGDAQLARAVGDKDFADKLQAGRRVRLQSVTFKTCLLRLAK